MLNNEHGYKNKWYNENKLKSKILALNIHKIKEHQNYTPNNFRHYNNCIHYLHKLYTNA